MKPQDSWQRLAAAARRASDDRDPSAPSGFATRVAARALAAAPAAWLDYFSPRVSLRAMGVACLMAAAAVGVSYPSLVKVFSLPAAPAVALPRDLPAPDSAAAYPAAANAPAANPPGADDPVAELVDVVS